MVLFGHPYMITGYLITIITLSLALVKYVTRKFNFWKERNINGPQPIPFMGNLWKVLTFKSSWATFLKNLYTSTEEPYVGFFTFDEPALLIRDPKIVKEILGKDFYYFQDRLMHQPEHNKVFANILFAMKNPEWKTTRAKLTPAFSSAKIKEVFHGVGDVCDEMINYIKLTGVEQNDTSLFKKFSTEVITRTVFGVKGQCFDREDSAFLKYASAMFSLSVRNGIVQTIYFFKDDNRLESQGLMFFAAGTETLATTIGFLLYELSMNQHIQQMVRKEITDTVKAKGLTYDTLKEMTYLDMCINESLRKYPSLPFLDRKCTANYEIPGTNFIIEKDTAVYICLLGLQNDERYFPEPEKFIPERFLHNVNESSCVYAPFGSGQRACIGYRFGFLSTKLAVVSILNNFSVEKTPKTPSSIEFDPKSVPLKPMGGLHLKFIPLT